MSLGRLRDALLGLGYVAFVVLIAAGSWLVYDQAFAARSQITLTTGTIGNALQEGSDVKLEGVPVGEVEAVRPRPGGAELTLAFEPDVLPKLSEGTTARLLPKTLFGERYVSLVEPEGAAGGTLRAGDTITQDTSDEAVELQQVFDELLPVLQSIQPDKLSAMLGELVLTLRGTGDDIGTAMVRWGEYLEKLNPLTPRMAENLGRLGRVAEGYADAAPDLVAALETMTTTSATLVDTRNQLRQAFATVTVSARDSDAWLTENSETIIALSEESRAALEAVRPYAWQFPCVLKALRGYIPVMDRVLAKGTNEPGLHVVINIGKEERPYVAGRDDPVYRTNGAPRCPYQIGQPPQSRQSRQPRAIPPPPSGDQVSGPFADANGLGEANSPAENQLIAELVAPTQEMAPSQYPEWSSLLLGPVLRGTEVTLR